MKAYLFAVLLACPTLCLAGDEVLPEVKALQAGMPPDVAAFIARVADCNHWGGEEPYDKERAEFIKNAVAKLRCDQLDYDERLLRAKYSYNQNVLEAMRKSKDLVW